MIDGAYVGNKADDLLYLANYNQAAVNTRRAPVAGVTPPDSHVRRHHLRLQRRQVAVQALQLKAEWRAPPAAPIEAR